MLKCWLHVFSEMRASERAEMLNDKRTTVHNGAGTDLHPSSGRLFFFSKDNNFEEQTFWRILIAGPKVQDSLRAEMQLGEPSKVRDSLRHDHGTAVLHN